MKPITNTELDFMNIIWNHAPVRSTRLVTLAGEDLGWKKSTTFTMLKKLGEKGLVVNKNAVVTPLVRREEVALQQGAAVLDKICGGSVNLLLASFLKKEPLTPEQARELKEIIDTYTFEEG